MCKEYSQTFCFYVRLSPGNIKHKTGQVLCFITRMADKVSFGEMAGKNIPLTNGGDTGLNYFINAINSSAVLLLMIFCTTDLFSIIEMSFLYISSKSVCVPSLIFNKQTN